MTYQALRGVIPPMMTPFTPEGEVDYQGHIANLEKWNSDALAGYLVLGSNSEAVYLSQEEKLTLIDLTVRHGKTGRPVLAGTGLESTRETIKLTCRAADLGAHGALVLTPSYYHGKMSDEALIAYFTQVADQSPIPVYLYNVPKFTHINVSSRVVKVLSRHPNIWGMKDSTGNVPQLVSFLSVIDKAFTLMVGTVSAWYPALTLGIRAGIFALANIAPNECASVQEAYDQGDSQGALEIYKRIFPVNTAVTATFGVAGLKYAAELRGYCGGAVRSPLLPATENEQEAIRDILHTAQLLAHR